MSSKAEVQTTQVAGLGELSGMSTDVRKDVPHRPASPAGTGQPSSELFGQPGTRVGALVPALVREAVVVAPGRRRVTAAPIHQVLGDDMQSGANGGTEVYAAAGPRTGDQVAVGTASVASGQPPRDGGGGGEGRRTENGGEDDRSNPTQRFRPVLTQALLGETAHFSDGFYVVKDVNGEQARISKYFTSLNTTYLERYGGCGPVEALHRAALEEGQGWGTISVDFTTRPDTTDAEGRQVKSYYYSFFVPSQADLGPDLATVLGVDFQTLLSTEEAVYASMGGARRVTPAMLRDALSKQEIDMDKPVVVATTFFTGKELKDKSEILGEDSASHHFERLEALRRQLTESQAGIPDEGEHRESAEPPDALSFGVPVAFGFDPVATVRRPSRDVFAGEATSTVDASRQRVEVHIHRDQYTYDYKHDIKQYGAETSGRLVVTGADGRLVAEVESLDAFLPYDSSSAEVAELADKTRLTQKTEPTARRTAKATVAALETLLSPADAEGAHKLTIPENFERNYDANGDRGVNRTEYVGETQQDDGTTLSVQVVTLANRTRLGLIATGQKGVRAIARVTLRGADNKLIAHIDGFKVVLPYDSDAPQVAKLAAQANKKTPDLLEGLARKTAQASLAALETFLYPQEAQEQTSEVVLVSQDDLRNLLAGALPHAEGRQVPAALFLVAVAGRLDQTRSSQQIAITRGELDALKKLNRQG